QERLQARAMDIEYRMQRISLVVMIGFVVLFAGVLFVRLRINRRMQLEEVRTRLSRDLHDDIGSTLSSINILTSLARKKAEAGDVEGAAASLTGISERSQRLQRNMSDIVWSVDPDRDSLEELLVRMREFGASVLEPKEITYRFDAQGDHSTALPPMVKSNLYLIFKEAVNNAAKHAQATAVSVAISYRNNRLKMTIADNGRGLPDSNGASRAHGGNGLRNMRKRAEEMNAELHMDSTPEKGTTIDLVIPL
ncbi:MAG TPA: sensor histidine kinase, partial [Flavobacteriales bacterium]|nr:sensor histidine kinase [Flavobacteriales bacterium]